MNRSAPPAESAGRQERAWPPPVGAIVRGPDGKRFEVIAAGRNDQLGRYVVLCCWQTFPVNRERWFARGYEIDREG